MCHHQPTGATVYPDRDGVTPAETSLEIFDNADGTDFISVLRLSGVVAAEVHVLINGPEVRKVIAELTAMADKRGW